MVSWVGWDGKTRTYCSFDLNRKIGLLLVESIG